MRDELEIVRGVWLVGVWEGRILRRDLRREAYCIVCRRICANLVRLLGVLSDVCADSSGLVYGDVYRDCPMVLMFLFVWPVLGRVHGNRDQVAEGAGVAWRKRP